MGVGLGLVSSFLALALAKTKSVFPRTYPTSTPITWALLPVPFTLKTTTLIFRSVSSLIPDLPPGDRSLRAPQTPQTQSKIEFPHLTPVLTPSCFSSLWVPQPGN